MKKAFLLSAAFLGAIALVGSPSGLSYSCADGTTYYGNCTPGRVTFNGSGYPALSHITVTRTSTGDIYDDFDYETSTGMLTFTETLYPAGSYTISVVANGNLMNQTVTTGTSYRHDDD